MPKLRASNQDIEMMCTECVMSIKYALDAYGKEEDAKEVEEAGISKEKNFMATFAITKGQAKNTQKFLHAIDQRHFRQKQKFFRTRLTQFNAFLDSFDNEIQDDDQEQVRFAKGLIDWLGNSHKILSEDSSRKMRESCLDPQWN